jgi:ATP-dependent DNA helicase RecQ
LHSVLNYVNEKKRCKNQIILSYFGEETKSECGICSNCIGKKKTIHKLQLVTTQLLELLQKESLNSREIQERTQLDSETVIQGLQKLLEEEKIVIKANNNYTIHI